MSTEFVKRPEIIFICYDEVIKNPYPFILHQMRTTYRNVYDNFINFSLIDKLNMIDLLKFCIQRRKVNIFHQLSKKEFDYKKSLNDIFYKYDDMYILSEPLIISSSIHVMLKQKFTEKIYIHTDKYDKRVHIDIQTQFKDMEKINYITGNLFNVISKLSGVTTYILRNILDVGIILELNKSEYTNIIVANYGYNFTLDEKNILIPRFNVEDSIMEKIFKFATFSPYNFK